MVTARTRPVRIAPQVAVINQRAGQHSLRWVNALMQRRNEQLNPLKTGSRDTLTLSAGVPLRDRAQGRDPGRMLRGLSTVAELLP